MVHLEGNAVLGAYGCSFNKRSLFVYKVFSDASGYSIRKANWVKLSRNHETLSSHFVQAIRDKFENKVKLKIELVKSREYQKLELRADIDQVWQNKSLRVKKIQNEQNKDCHDSVVVDGLKDLATSL